MRLLLTASGDIESNLGPGSDRRVRVLDSNIRGLHANLDEYAVAGSDYGVLVCAESKVSDRRHHSELRIPGFYCPQQRLRYSTPGAQGRLDVREGLEQSKLECSCHKSCLFRICRRTNNFYVYALYHNPGDNFSLGSMARVQSVDHKAVFVIFSNDNAHHSERLESISPTHRHGRDVLDFCNLSGCKQLVRCPTHIAGNRLDLVMTLT